MNSGICGRFGCRYLTEGCTHWVSPHHFRIIDHSYEVDDGERGVEHVGEEEVLVECDPLAAQAPV